MKKLQLFLMTAFLLAMPNLALAAEMPHALVHHAAAGHVGTQAFAYGSDMISALQRISFERAS